MYLWCIVFARTLCFDFFAIVFFNLIRGTGWRGARACRDRDKIHRRTLLRPRWPYSGLWAIFHNPTLARMPTSSSTVHIPSRTHFLTCFCLLIPCWRACHGLPCTAPPCSYVRMLKNSLVRKSPQICCTYIHGDPHVFNIELSEDLLPNYWNLLLNVSQCIIRVVGFQVKISPRSTRNSLNLTSKPV